MKTTIILCLLCLSSFAAALPAELEPRFTFSFPSFGGKKTTTLTSSITKSPTSSSTLLLSTTTASIPTTSSAASTTTAAPPASTATGGNTENGIVNGECKELTVIFARGTSEPGNVGVIAGPPMFQVLRDTLGAAKVTVQGVDYPASSAGNANGGADGGPTMKSLANQVLSQCPTTKLALSGYSQGAMVVHNAVSQQGLAASQISAIVLFGDPFNGQSVGSVPAGSVLELCASGDHVCDGSGTFAITEAHLGYGQNATQAADFIIQTAGVS